MKLNQHWQQQEGAEEQEGGGLGGRRGSEEGETQEHLKGHSQGQPPSLRSIPQTTLGCSQINTLEYVLG